MLKKILIGLAAIAALIVAAIAVVLVIAATSDPDKFVSRSTTVNAPVEVIFEQVNDLEKWNTWNPWQEMDPDLRIEYGPTRVGKGAWYSWTSDEVGTGKLTITDSVAYESIESSLDFGEMGMGTATWSFTQNGDAVEVTWGFTSHGRHLMDKVFHLFLESFLGPQFESGLASLKEVAESAPPPVPAPVATETG